MNHEEPSSPFSPINQYEVHEIRPEGYRSPDIAVAESIIEEGIRESVLAGESYVRVTVKGKRIHLGQYLSGDLYKLRLSPGEVEEIFDRYLGVRIVGGELVRGANPNAALGHGAVKAMDDYDFRERQAGSYLDD